MVVWSMMSEEATQSPPPVIFFFSPPAASTFSNTARVSDPTAIANSSTAAPVSNNPPLRMPSSNTISSPQGQSTTNGAISSLYRDEHRREPRQAQQQQLQTPSVRLGIVHRIRLVPQLDSAYSLLFEPIIRNVVEGGAPLRIGRFGSADRQVAMSSAPNAQNATKVAFPSRVISRFHAEIWAEDDGNIRLAAATIPSRPFPLQDGDIIQLGVDYQGGHQEIHRCVKIKVEIARDWQSLRNTLNSSIPGELLSSNSLLDHDNPDNQSTNGEDDPSDDPNELQSGIILEYLSRLARLGAISSPNLANLDKTEKMLLLDDVYTDLSSRSITSTKYTKTLKLLQDLSHHLYALPASFQLENVGFDRKNVIGRGGEATVYRGQMMERAVVIREIIMPPRDWNRPLGRKVTQVLFRPSGDCDPSTHTFPSLMRSYPTPTSSLSLVFIVRRLIRLL
ncbi:hypothetical protein DL93DRAFT_2082453 [Clavulina sp. PMI_390]|nr:hypothetical protein DL93DRAFT_2082453 [Clavulina sp. PMI_390]